MDVAGLIPLVGTMASVAGIGADIGAHVAEAQAKSGRWYLLGAKIREIAIRDVLMRRK
jgi:hypothetical protein